MATKKRSGGGDPVVLRFQVLIGCAWVDALPQHVRRGATFRALRPDDSTHRFASGALPHVQDAGVYQASDHGDEHGVPFFVTPPEFELVAGALSFDAGD